jgi:hypothetical protein
MTSSQTGRQRPYGPGEQAGDRRALRRWLACSARRERRLQQTGSELDPRFTFANERTFLAWNRTARWR